jgi:formylmethanofuran dehydrogenase subunit A
VMTWSLCLARIASMIDEHTHLAGKPAVQRPFGRPEHRYKKNIKTYPKDQDTKYVTLSMCGS